MSKEPVTIDHLNYILKGIILGALAVFIGLASYIVYQYQIIINMNQ
jgi:hypothetical protein